MCNIILAFAYRVPLSDSFVPFCLGYIIDCVFLYNSDFLSCLNESCWIYTCGPDVLSKITAKLLHHYHYEQLQIPERPT